MSKSETIRSLGRDGYSVGDIARRVGVRYQFARNVLLAAGLLTPKPRQSIAPGAARRQEAIAAIKPTKKPELLVEVLVHSGFEASSAWSLSSAGALVLDRPLPKSPGVYTMVRDGRAVYVGLATMGIAKRFYFYARPGATQVTSRRINQLLKAELQNAVRIDIYTATPPDLEWKGLPVSGSAGLELGLIERYSLPWNIRSAKQ